MRSGHSPQSHPFSVSIIRAAKAAGKGITVETCPHYLSLSAEDVADGDTRFKCAPPLRDAGNRKALVAALLAGDIDLVSSDHSPAPPAMKRPHDGDFLRAWGGISSLQFGLSVTWTAVREAGGSVDHLAAWWSSRPAQLVGLSQKGAIVPGSPLLLVCPCSCGFLADPMCCRQGCRLRGVEPRHAGGDGRPACRVPQAQGAPVPGPHAVRRGAGYLRARGTGFRRLQACPRAMRHAPAEEKQLR